MSELKKPGVPYVLSLANRLYGEQSYQFVEVRLKEMNSRFVMVLKNMVLEMIYNSIDLLC